MPLNIVTIAVIAFIFIMVLLAIKQIIGPSIRSYEDMFDVSKMSVDEKNDLVKTLMVKDIMSLVEDADTKVAVDALLECIKKLK